MVKIELKQAFNIYTFQIGFKKFRIYKRIYFNNNIEMWMAEHFHVKSIQLVKFYMIKSFISFCDQNAVLKKAIGLK